jgi:hypothetical protein
MLALWLHMEGEDCDCSVRELSADQNCSRAQGQALQATITMQRKRVVLGLVPVSSF